LIRARTGFIAGFDVAKRVGQVLQESPRTMNIVRRAATLPRTGIRGGGALQIRLGCCVHNLRVVLEPMRCTEYPVGPDYFVHPIGTQINGQGLRVTILAADGNGFIVPKHVVEKMRTRRFGGPAFGTGPSIVVTLDYMEGNNADHDLNEGWRWERHFQITGLAGEMATAISDLLNDAEAALVAIVGNRGSAGPQMFTGTTVGGSPVYANSILLRFSYEMLSPDLCKGSIHYRGYPLPTMKFGGAIGHIESNLDVNGNPIYVQYTYKSDYGMNQTPSGQSPTGTDPSLAGFTDTVSKLIDKPVFEAIVGLEFTIYPPCTLGSVVVNAAAIASFYKAQQGSVNNNLFDPTGVSYLYPGLGYLLGAPGCYLLEDVDAESFDGEVTFKITMSFHLRATSWLTTVTYVCRDTGEPPADLVPGTGQKQIQVYPEVSFPSVVFEINN
jgi:hypothetical protein